MSNTITIELSKEDRQRLDEIVAFLGQTVGLVGELTRTTTKTVAPTPAEIPATPSTDHPVDEVSPHGQPEPVTEPEAPKWTKADLQARVQALAAPGTGKREKVREIVKSYAEKVGDIPADKYDEVMDKLTALEQEG